MKQFLVVSAIFCCLVVVASGANNYVDSKIDKIADLAELVCKNNKGTNNLIGKFHTIRQLTAFFSELPSDHKLNACRNQYLQSIKDLVATVEMSSGDVCEHVGMLEQYHQKYVSKVSKYRKEQKKGNQAPEMIKLFFMQYATTVSSMCEQNAIEMIADRKHTVEPETLAKVEELKKFTDQLGMSDLHKGYNGIYLFWNMVDNLNLSEKDKFSKYLKSYGDTRAYVQMKDGRAFNALQAICLHHLKPVYSVSLLPVLRLVDMGYYPNSSQLMDQLNSEPTTRSLFFATQVCETFMPVAVYSDDKLEENQLVAITEDESSQLTLPELENLDKIVESKPVVNAKPLPIYVNELVFGETPVDLIKSTVSSRGKVVNRMLKQVAKVLMSKLMSVFSFFKLFRKEHGQKIMVVEPEVNPSELQIEEEADGEIIKRKKRGFMDGLVKVFLIVIVLVYLIILTAFKLVFFSIPYVLVSLFGGAKKTEYQNWMKYFGVNWMYAASLTSAYGG